MSKEIHFKLLRLLDKEPELSQREIADRLGISLGKVNYCVRALAEKGWVKIGNFYRSNHKSAYLYQLTPKGVKEKAKLAVSFLRRKEVEYLILKQEIEKLRAEVSGLDSDELDQGNL